MACALVCCRTDLADASAYFLVQRADGEGGALPFRVNGGNECASVSPMCAMAQESITGAQTVSERSGQNEDRT